MRGDRDTFVVVNNKAEGCAPASVSALAHVVAGVRFIDGDPELGDRGIVQGVQLVRTVDRDRGDAVGDVEGQELIGHGGRVRSGVRSGEPQIYHAALASTRRPATFGACPPSLLSDGPLTVAPSAFSINGTSPAPR